jgi:hypothetical protein
MGPTAVAPYDFTHDKTMIDFLPGQASATFTVPIADHGVFGRRETIQIGLFGPSPIGMALPWSTILTIINDDPPVSIDRLNPLGVAHDASAAGNPPAGASLFVDHQNEPSLPEAQYPSLSVIANPPGTGQFGSFSGPDPGVAHHLPRCGRRRRGPRARDRESADARRRREERA